MALLDEALAVAKSFVPSEQDDDSGRLMTFCKAAEMELISRLREGVTEEDCADTMVCAIAWLALSYLCAGRSYDAQKFSVGDLTVERDSSGQAAVECLRTQAMLLMAPYVQDSEFGFRGVPV